MTKNVKTIIAIVAIVFIGIVLYMVFSKDKSQFPLNPKEGDRVTVNGKDYTYIGSKWVPIVVTTGPIIK